MARVLITGAAGGIGIELVRHYLAVGDEVIAVCRDPGPGLSALRCERVDDADLTRAQGIERVATAVAGRRLDLVIHNAGLLRRDDYASLASAGADIRAQFELNALAPLLLTAALDASLGEGSKLALISKIGRAHV